MCNEVKSVGDRRQSWIGERLDVIRNWGDFGINMGWFGNVLQLLEVSICMGKLRLDTIYESLKLWRHRQMGWRY